MTAFDFAMIALAYCGFGNWWFCHMRSVVDAHYGKTGHPAVVIGLAHIAVMFVWPVLMLRPVKKHARRRAEGKLHRYQAHVAVRGRDIDAMLEGALRRMDNEDVAAILRGEVTFADALGAAIPKALTATEAAKVRDFIRNNADAIYDRWNTPRRAPSPCPGNDAWPPPPGVGASLADMEAHHGSAPHPSAFDADPGEPPHPIFDADHDNGEFPKAPIKMNPPIGRAITEHDLAVRYQNGLNCPGEACDDPSTCPLRATCSMHSNGGN